MKSREELLAVCDRCSVVCEERRRACTRFATYEFLAGISGVTIAGMPGWWRLALVPAVIAFAASSVSWLRADRQWRNAMGEWREAIGSLKATTYFESLAIDDQLRRVIKPAADERAWS